jgi:cell division septal protein FtsQ
MFFSKRRKLDARRRFGTREFRSRVRQASKYRRPYIRERRGILKILLGALFSNRKITRYLIFFILIAGFYYLVLSSYFLVTNISINGNDQVSTEQIIQVIESHGKKRTWLIPKSHLLLMTRGRLSKLTSENITLIKEVITVNRSWPNSVSITVVERKPGFVMQVKNRNLLLDEEGVVVRELTQPEENLVIVINQAEEDVIIGETLPNPKLTAFILSMYRSWPRKISSGIAAVKITSKETQEIQFESIEGWSAFFDVNRSALSQLGNLSLILDRQIPQDQRENLAYVDLRLEKWVYYCFNDTPCSSQPQEEIVPETEP